MITWPIYLGFVLALIAVRHVIRMEEKAEKKNGRDSNVDFNTDEPEK